MGADSRIPWTHHTWNPWWGCTKVSEGCKNCYAEAFARRTGHNVWGKDAPRRFFGEDRWLEPLKWDEEARIAGVRRRVFCASMADVFEHVLIEGGVGDQIVAARVRLWELIRRTPGLDWLLLTKRPENIWRMGPEVWPRNVWLGVTAENQARYEQRWPRLARAAEPHGLLTFISHEPACGPLELLCNGCGHDVGAHLAPDRGGCPGWFPDWVITGGESGTAYDVARPYDLRWARDLRDQCRRAGIPFFMKQVGVRPSMGGPSDHVHLRRSSEKHGPLPLDRKGEDPSEWPTDLRIREFPTSRAA